MQEVLDKLRKKSGRDGFSQKIHKKGRTPPPVCVTIEADRKEEVWDMDRSLRKTADAIVRAGIEAVLPDAAVARALEQFDPGGGRVVLVAAGKAAWQMARAALDCLGHV